MNSSELNIFNSMPFLFWVKNEEGTYIWGNKVINDLAGENVVGRKDKDLVWAANAESLRADDEKVWESGKPEFTHELVDHSGEGKATLNVCKFIGDFEGQRCVFGISFIIPGPVS
ncbi:MAG: PAS domain-containing protein [Ignavibacteriae bacterium]|nr:PAS domain-containing protein [Ignavibacteriota bacterium]